MNEIITIDRVADQNAYRFNSNLTCDRDNEVLRERWEFGAPGAVESSGAGFWI